MPINDDGPWGSPSQKPNPKKTETQTPWGRRDTNGGGSQGGSEPPPDFDAMLADIKRWFESFKPRRHAHGILIAIGVVVALWLSSGFYQVATNQMGVVMRFGAFNRIEGPGLHYHLPAPIEEVLLPVVTAQNEIPVGFRRLARQGDERRNIPQESMMLTQDENLINVEFTVFWRINDVAKYLFEIRDPVQTIKMAAESAMRDVIGQNKLQFALTDGRGQIADETRTRLQALMDEYEAGVVITQINLQTVSVPEDVKAAFQDVINARLDQERAQNQAAAHVNRVIPEAKGQAAQLMQQAMAYRDQKIAIARGEAERFNEVHTAYNAARDVTARRLYLETMESILGDAQKVIMDKSTGAVPYLPLPQLKSPNERQGGTP